MATDIKKRSTLLGLAGAVGALGMTAPVAGRARELFKTPEERALKAELVLQIHVELGETEDMGMSADGHRINYPIVGGHFSGRGLQGKVIPGGADMSVERNDGVTMINALYRLKTNDGDTIIIDNAGIWRPTEVGLKKMQSGAKLLAEDYYCLTTPKFKTPAGKHNWLTQNIFVGTIDDVSDNAVLIGCYLMNQIG
ncbi:DUF3237 family protein [Microbulbifer bruguierae]|uniref:DUF3237 family protein n=1 Tax=Microbulbifer bruguierae TaxID=3029061 RepID=A0ABY8NBS3_9GAMM|nr:DUF3237 family protein [Microbulbifer bruguierae]WGL15890.1 DUF3237 family protein [Microbulbifer bruguierae]